MGGGTQGILHQGSQSTDTSSTTAEQAVVVEAVEAEMVSAVVPSGRTTRRGEGDVDGDTERDHHTQPSPVHNPVNILNLMPTIATDLGTGGL